MYKSSPFTFVFKYVFPVIILASVFFSIYKSWNYGAPESLGLTKAIITLSIWILFFLVQMPFRLKNIETTEKGIFIKDYGTTKTVAYKDIAWVSKFDITSPWFVTIKYKDESTGAYKKISFIPNQRAQRLFANDEMSEFIKNKIISENVNYTEDNQPSKLKNILLLMILGLPFVLLAFYFMNDTLKIF